IPKQFNHLHSTMTTPSRPQGSGTPAPTCVYCDKTRSKHTDEGYCYVVGTNETMALRFAPSAPTTAQGETERLMTRARANVERLRERRRSETGRILENSLDSLIPAILADLDGALASSRAARGAGATP